MQLKKSATTGPHDRPKRRSIGVWTEWLAGVRWSDQGMTRLLGFLIEGMAQSEAFLFRIVVPACVKTEVEDDLATLEALAGTDYIVESPSPGEVEDEDFGKLAAYANDKVAVEGWLVLFPFLRHASSLDAPIAVIFPDANPMIFPVFDACAWGPRGDHVRWRDAVRELVENCRRVITFSHHVALQHVIALFDIDPEKIRVIPHAAPNLLHLLPFVEDGRKTGKTIQQAADMLRNHAISRNWHNLFRYPFEDVCYIALSTQDRTTKNLHIVAEATRILVRERRLDVKLITTASLHDGEDWTAFPAFVRSEGLNVDVISMPHLPREVHAAFYHCAAITVHPAIFEGGRGPFPFYEAVSVGTPCLMARGPHTMELLESAPELAPFVFLPDDAYGLAHAIQAVMLDARAVVEVQSNYLKRVGSYGWADAAYAYCTAATDG